MPRHGEYSLRTARQLRPSSVLKAFPRKWLLAIDRRLQQEFISWFRERGYAQKGAQSDCGFANEASGWSQWCCHMPRKAASKWPPKRPASNKGNCETRLRSAARFAELVAWRATCATYSSALVAIQSVTPATVNMLALWRPPIATTAILRQRSAWIDRGSCVQC